KQRVPDQQEGEDDERRAHPGGLLSGAQRPATKLGTTKASGLFARSFRLQRLAHSASRGVRLSLRAPGRFGNAALGSFVSCMANASTPCGEKGGHPMADTPFRFEIGPYDTGKLLPQLSRA